MITMKFSRVQEYSLTTLDVHSFYWLKSSKVYHIKILNLDGLILFNNLYEYEFL